MSIKNSKFKNTGLIFELLVRQITSDTLSNVNSSAVSIIKKHFVKSELLKEYKLYETLLKKSNLTEGKAEIIINTLLEASTKLNKSRLRREKYNLIKEIKSNYDLDSFFKTHLPNYRLYASFYVLLENQNSEGADYNQIINHKTTLLEYLTSKPTSKVEPKDNIIKEFESYDKDTRILTYRILLEKFNDKYKTFNYNQKRILKEFINSIDSTPALRDFYNSEILKIKKTISELNGKTSDAVTKIKLTEINKLLQEVKKSSKVKDEDLVNLLQYHALIGELKKVNGI